MACGLTLDAKSKFLYTMGIMVCKEGCDSSFVSFRFGINRYQITGALLTKMREICLRTSKFPILIGMGKILVK